MITNLDLIEMFSEIAVAMTENRDLLNAMPCASGETNHGATMKQVFAGLEDTLATIDPAELRPGELFDAAAEAFLKVDTPSARLYASGFRRAGSALTRRRSLSNEDFAAAITAVSSGFGNAAPAPAALRDATRVWETIAPALRKAVASGVPVVEALDLALTAANGGKSVPATLRDAAPELEGYDATGLSALLLVRAIRDDLE